MDLKQKSISGVKWNSILSLAASGLQLMTLIALARLLPPAALGLVGMTTLVVGFAQTFADMGISNAIIHSQHVEMEDLSSLFWLNVLVGLAIFAIICAINPLVTAFYHEPRLSGPLYLSSLIFLITPFGQISQVLLQKELNFKSQAMIQLVGSSANAVLSILLAFLGLDVFSIICGQLASTILQVSLSGYCARKFWKPGWCFSRVRIKKYMSFGLYQMGEKIINYFNTNLDYLLIGSLLGAKQLGYYTLAYTLVLKPSLIINPILTKVAFPVFSKIQNDTVKVKNGYLKMLKYVSAINCPIMCGLAAVAPFAIPLLGPQWLPSISLIQILSVVGLLRSLSNPIGALLLAKGRADLGFKWNLGIMIAQIPGLYLGARLGGSVGVAVAFALLMVVYIIAEYPILIAPVLDPCLAEYVHSMYPTFWKSGVMGVSVFMAGSMMQGIPQSLVFCAQILLGAALYLGLMCITEKDLIAEMKDLWHPGKPTVTLT